MAFVYCTKPSETPANVDASITADPAVTASSSSAGMEAPPVAAIVSASASSSTSASAPSKRLACEALQRKVTTLFATGRACTTSADCTNLMTTVGLDGQCGAPISKTSMPDVQKVKAEFQAKRCLDVLPPQPTATCPIPPTPTCVNGQCN